MASRDISEEDSSSELDELSDSEFDGWCDESNTMVQFEKPLFTALDTAPVIKIPHPLARKLMETLSLINPPITEILSFCKYYGFDHKSKSVDATQAAARETIASRFQGWVRVVCNKGISIWWRPSTGESQYIKPHSLVYKVDETVRDFNEVIGHVAVSRFYHLRAHAISYKRPAPSPKAANEPEQPKRKTGSSVNKPIVSTSSLKVAGEPERKKRKTRSSAIKPIKSISLVNAKDVSLASVKIKAATASMPADINDAFISAIWNFVKKAKFRYSVTLPDDALRFLVFFGSDECTSFDITSYTYKANLLEAVILGTSDEGRSEGVRVLAEAGYERYWKADQYTRQEAFISFLQANKNHTEKWLPRLNGRQAKTIKEISHAIRIWVKNVKRTLEEKEEEEKSKLTSTIRAVQYLFSTTNTEEPGANGAAFAYKPLRTVTPQDGLEHPAPLFSANTFRRIEDFFLVPGQTVDANEWEDEPAFEDVDSGVAEEHLALKLRQGALEEFAILMENFMGLMVYDPEGRTN